MKKCKPFLCVGAAVATFAASAVPVVPESSVKASQESITRNVTIEYQLTGEPGIVTVDIQTNVTGDVWASIGGEHYQNMYGDVNRVVTNTTTKSHVYWHPDQDWGDADPKQYNVRAVVTAWSTNSPPDYMAVDFTTKSNYLFYANAGSVPGGITNRKYKTDWMLMRKVPARGVIWRMGSPTTETGRPSGALAKVEPARLVVFTNDYYLGVYELTQKQYWNISDGYTQGVSAPSTYNSGDDAEMRPVESLMLDSFRGSGNVGSSYSWPENGHTVQYATTMPKWYRLGYLRVKTGLLFDLPTSAQWEYACRAGTAGRFNDGSDSMDDVGWNSSNWDQDPSITSNMTHVVGLKKPNAWGLYDMHGNVREHVLERFYYPEAEDGVTYIDPTIPKGTTNPYDGANVYRHLTCGGSVADSENDCRSAARVRIQTTTSGQKNNGYRLWLPAIAPHLGQPMAFK